MKISLIKKPETSISYIQLPCKNFNILTVNDNKHNASVNNLYVNFWAIFCLSINYKDNINPGIVIFAIKNMYPLIYIQILRYSSNHFPKQLLLSLLIHLCGFFFFLALLLFL